MKTLAFKLLLGVIAAEEDAAATADPVLADSVTDACSGTYPCVIDYTDDKKNLLGNSLS